MALSTNVRYLIDTSVLKRLRDPRVRELIEPLAQRALLARSTICDLEVGYSARNEAEWEQLADAL